MLALALEAPRHLFLKLPPLRFLLRVLRPNTLHRLHRLGAWQRDRRTGGQEARRTRVAAELRERFDAVTRVAVVPAHYQHVVFPHRNDGGSVPVCGLLFVVLLCRSKAVHMRRSEGGQGRPTPYQAQASHLPSEAACELSRTANVMCKLIRKVN